MGDPAVDLCLLDRFGCTVDGGARQLGPTLARVLAFLAIHPWPSRYVIAGMLWPDRHDESALAALRTAVWRLQQQAPGAVNVKARTLTLAPDVRVDLHEYLAWAQRVLRDPAALADADLEPPAAGSELLPGWYDDWLEPERQRLQQLRVHAMETVAAEHLGRGRPGQALMAAFTALQADPLRESTHRLVVRIHLAEGNVGAALHQYGACRHLLETEVGVAPSAALAELVAPYLR
jgi:DNA-binding SARP family transcriptional activator